VAQALRAAGHDVATVHQQELAGWPDADIAAAVKAESRCLVTFDLDFADTRRYPPSEFSGMVVLRLRHRTAARQIERITQVVAGGAQLAGRLWIVEDDRVCDWTP
jgi:predicted nuclease of predicted toxin-antitoxin system